MTIYFDTLEHFCPTSKFQDNGWFPEIRKEKDEFRDLNSQLKDHINHLKVSVSSLKDILTSCSPRSEIAENQIQSLFLRIAELLCKLDPRLHSVSAVEMRVLIGREWDPENWNGDVWENSEEFGGIKLPKSAESSLSVEATIPLPPEEISPALPKETLMASPEVVAF